ncbi:MAG: hypothetical protein LBG19_00130 [Prevotellaceae bacterium]|jgi:hypothetical protein|nr:hypothetical protein [Prevotellaceae bacterium]
MKKLVSAVTLLLLAGSIQSQEMGSNDYLINNRVDLRHDNIYCDQKIVGFTAIHGSKKSEEAEIALIKAQLEQVDTLIYMPEVDVAMGYYFNIYLGDGDEALLKDIILTYEKYVSQEASVEMFEKWKALRELSQGKRVVVYGLDYVRSYKYFVKLLLEIGSYDDKLLDFWNDKQTDYSVKSETPLKQYLRAMISDPQNKDVNHPTIAYLYENIADSFAEKSPYRDSIMYRNYTVTVKKNFGSAKQLVRMGFGHMTKARFVKLRPSFIAQLIEGGICKPTEVYIAMAQLYGSSVLLERRYDENGVYYGYDETNNPFYTGEGLFPGLDVMVANKLSDMTLFDFSKESSPFREVKGQIYPGFELLPGTTLADYFDGMILIESSEANEPIEAIL